MMKRRLHVSCTVVLCASAWLIPDASAQTETQPDHDSRFAQVRGLRMHYLDFGGSGLPIIFLHGGHGDARNFVDFAPRFVDGFRVLALDRRGTGQSEAMDWGYTTAAQAEDVLGFMDALGLDRAVLIGFNRPVAAMTYLAEHHPDRLAGVVYLAHEAPAIELQLDPATAELSEMALRTACDWDEESRRRTTQRDGYRPHFIDDPEFRIEVPALSFANAEGTRYPADFDLLEFFLQGGATREWCDPTAKAYFSALAADTARANELRRKRRLDDVARAAHHAAFESAFGPNLSVVKLDVRAITGYETERAPDLVYPHIKRFVEGIDEPAEDGGDP
jgi:pimeloyl-ACP methyl ester carboxylesterase